MNRDLPEDSEAFEFRPFRPGDETAILDVLRQNLHSWEFRDEAYWRWQHTERPGFRGEDIVTVWHGDEMVGCFHGAVMPLRLANGLDAPVRLDGDFVIVPEHRRKGLPTMAHDIEDRRLLAAGVVLRGGFTSRELNERFYGKRYGYVLIPTDTSNWRRPLRPAAFSNVVTESGRRLLGDSRLAALLAQRPARMSVFLDGVGDFNITLTAGGFALEEGVAESDLSLRLPYRVIWSAGRGLVRGVGSAFMALIRGQVRVRGVVQSRRLLLALGRAALTGRRRL